MEQKRSGIGMIAGILYSILFIYDTVVTLMNVRYHPSAILNIGWFAGECVSVFLIISLFGERRSRLLLISYIISAVLFLWQIIDFLRDGSYEALYSVTFLMMAASMVLRTVMVVYCCIPSLQRDAGWTGNIWFLPPVLHGIVSVINILQYPAMYWENFQYHPLWQTFQLSLNVISIVAEFLFCLWLTEPYRHKKLSEMREFHENEA